MTIRISYDCIMSVSCLKNVNLCEYSIDVQSKWNIMFILS